MSSQAHGVRNSGRLEGLGAGDTERLPNVATTRSERNQPAEPQGDISAAELARSLDVANHTIARWRRQGRGPRSFTVVTSGARPQVRFRVADVLRWARETGTEIPNPFFGEDLPEK